MGIYKVNISDIITFGNVWIAQNTELSELAWFLGSEPATISTLF